MKSLALLSLVLLLGAGTANVAYADPLADIQAFTLNDVKTAEAIYAANPSVPTYAAATQCLGFLDVTLSTPGSPLTFGNLSAPAGVASTVADLDVALNTANSGLPPVVLTFNQNCGGYIEDLKAEAAAQAGTFVFAGIKL